MLTEANAADPRQHSLLTTGEMVSLTQESEQGKHDNRADAKGGIPSGWVIRKRKQSVSASLDLSRTTRRQHNEHSAFLHYSNNFNDLTCHLDIQSMMEWWENDCAVAIQRAWRGFWALANFQSDLMRIVLVQNEFHRCKARELMAQRQREVTSIQDT